MVNLDLAPHAAVGYAICSANPLASICPAPLAQSGRASLHPLLIGFCNVLTNENRSYYNRVLY